jgi:hypothetical protein
VRHREDPRAQVGRVAQLRIRAERRDPRLLVAVVGVRAAYGGAEEPVDIAAVVVEKLLERRKVHR